MAYENVTEIVFQNNRFPLNGATVDEVLQLLNVPSNAELAVQGTALVITEKSGTKGADEDLLTRLAAAFGAENLNVEKVPLKRNKNGKWVPQIPGFTLEEVEYLLDRGVELKTEMTEEEVEVARVALEERDAELIAAAHAEAEQKIAEAGLDFTYDQLVALKEVLASL